MAAVVLRELIITIISKTGSYEFHHERALFVLILKKISLIYLVIAGTKMHRRKRHQEICGQVFLVKH